jgi:uncharacterized membrane protein
MPTVNSSIEIAAPLDRVYAIAKDNESFPDFMDDVQSLTPVESEGGRVVSDFVGVVAAFALKIRWRQEDLWDDTTHTCKFKQLEGPGLGPLVAKVVHSLVVKNVDGILEAIKKRAEDAA